MAFFLKPKPGSKPLIERFSGAVEKVKTAQSRLRQQRRDKIREETLYLREQISLTKQQQKLDRLRERAKKSKTPSTSMFGSTGGGFGF